MHIAARAVIDSALGQHDTLPALNVVHPGPIPWSSMIHSVADALVKENIVTSGPIPIAPVGEWFSTLEHRALNPSEDDLKNIVSASNISSLTMIFILRLRSLPYNCSISSEHSRRLLEAQTQLWYSRLRKRRPSVLLWPTPNHWEQRMYRGGSDTGQRKGSCR